MSSRASTSAGPLQVISSSSNSAREMLLATGSGVPSASIRAWIEKQPKLVHIPMWLARLLVRLIRLLSKQFGDLADFIVTAGEYDGVAPQTGRHSLRAHFEELVQQDTDTDASPLE